MPNSECPVKTVPLLKMSLLLPSLLLFCGPVQAQVQEGRHNLPSAQAPQPPSHAAPSIPGTDLPPAARPADPPSAPGRTYSSGTRGPAKTSAPDTPADPAQAPIDGGLGWLAAAGAAYAANRLRKQAAPGDDE